jgi:hypothetical protein
MDGGQSALDHVGLLSVVIDDLHFESVTLDESETDAPRIVDANTPLFLAISSQFLQPVGRRKTQVLDTSGSIQLRQSS